MKFIQPPLPASGCLFIKERNIKQPGAYGKSKKFNCMMTAGKPQPIQPHSKSANRLPEKSQRPIRKKANGRHSGSYTRLSTATSGEYACDKDSIMRHNKPPSNT